MKKENEVHEPLVHEKKSISFVWILPVLLFVALAWVAYENYSKRGVNITVSFNSAEGLKAGSTTLEYKGLVLGKVTKININDLNSVNVNILLRKDVAKYIALDSSSFWINKPTVSLTKISGLSTIISGYKIEFATTVQDEKDLLTKKEKFNFVGLETKPDIEMYPNGYYISLHSANANIMEVETPIFYNNFQIGEIVSKDFIKDRVILKAYIYDKYHHLVNQSSQFTVNKALKATLGPSGLNLEVSSVYSALVGGIIVTTKDKTAKKIQKDEVVVLHKSQEELQDKVEFSIYLDSAKGIDNKTTIMYKGLYIGSLTDIEINKDDELIAKAYVLEKFKYLLTKNSKFSIQTPSVSLEGVQNLGNIITGNFIELDYEKGDENFVFNIKNTEETKANSKEEFTLSLYSTNLNSITEKSKVYFKNIPIGYVSSYSLTSDFKKVKVDVKIENKFKKLINDKTIFYDISSKLVELKDLDLSINYSGLKPLLEGAISIINIDSKAKLSKRSFDLYSSYKEANDLKRVQTKGSLITSYFDNSFSIKKGQPLIYKGQEIGFVSSISFDEEFSKAKLFVYSEYKKYISSKSRFYKSDAVKFDAGLTGLVFELDSLQALINGSIKLDNSSSKSFDKYMIYSSKDIMKSSQESIEVVFENVAGVKPGFSKLTYNGVNIGKVIDISLTSEHKARVKIQIDKDYEAFAKRGTIYYLKKPKISLNEVSNIGSSIMPVKIGVIKSTNNAFASSFKGYDSINEVPRLEDSSLVNITSLHPTSLGIDAPVYYKNVEIGKVSDISLSHDGSKILIKTQIKNDYKHLIRTNSTFYDISGLEFKFSIFSGAKLETNTITSIIKGGLLVVTPYEYNDIASEKTNFILEKNVPEGWQKLSPSIKIRD